MCKLLGSNNDRRPALLLLQVVTGEEVEALQAAGELLFSEQACGYLYGVTKAAVQAVQYQDKVSLVALVTHILMDLWCLAHVACGIFLKLHRALAVGLRREVLSALIERHEQRTWTNSYTEH